MSFFNYSLKTKTIIFVFVFFMILFAFTAFFRYTEFKETLVDAEATSSINIMSVYQDSINRTFNFFSTCGEIKILSKAIRKALINHDGTSINSLLKEQWQGLNKKYIYLKDIQFYGADLKPIHSFANLPFSSHKKRNLKVKESYGTFFIYNNNFNYHVIVPAYNDGTFIGAINFVINPMLFLTNMNESLNVKTMIFINKLFYTQSDKNSDENCTFKLLTSTLLHEDNAQKLFNEIEICNKESIELDGKKFITHILNALNYDGITLAKFVFLQDVTQENLKLAYWAKKNIILYLTILFLTFFTLIYAFNILTRRLEITNKKLKESQYSLEQLNISLESKINKEIEKRIQKEKETRKKEKIIIRQDKLASMGEMIGNIAHQWRQPLTEIGSILIHLELSFEHGTLTKKSLNNLIEKSNKTISHMSQTIDDFRNFFASDEKIMNFCINDACKKSFTLMGASLENNHIKLIFTEKKNFYINGLKGELVQAILNILANAKDILIHRKIIHPTIWFNIFERDNQCIIQIEDNGGGIHFEPISKIFEPYITSKHANTGTGIGLYMTKTIIEKNSNGSLSAQNSKNGAVFEIIF